MLQQLLPSLFLLCYSAGAWHNGVVRSMRRMERTTVGGRGPIHDLPPPCFTSLSAATAPGDEYFNVRVNFDGRSCEVPIRSDETILSGLERARVTDRLAMPELPSECRRGNCLTCVGRHTSNSNATSLQQGEDGLSPEMSRQASRKGFVLTCSSRVVGDGVQLELGENHKAWKDLYYNRLRDESTQYVARSAMAKTIRMSDERNPERWVMETEEVFSKSGGEQ